MLEKFRANVLKVIIIKILYKLTSLEHVFNKWIVHST